MDAIIFAKASSLSCFNRLTRLSYTYRYNSTNDPIDGDQVVVLMAIAVFLSAIGLAAIYFQCRRLRQRLRNKRQDDLSDPAPQLAAFTKQIQSNHKQSYHDLVAQMAHVRNMKAQVRATLTGLQTAVSQLQARETNDTEENVHVDESLSFMTKLD
jgi:hypothetical protein